MKTTKKQDTFLRWLYREAREYERLNINGQPKAPARRNARYWIAIPVSAFVCCSLPGGYPPTFLEMASTILSIFIGLLLTALVFALDKFYQPRKDTPSDYDIEFYENDRLRNLQISLNPIVHPDSKGKLWQKQSKQYISKFNVLVGVNVLTSLWALALICLCTLYPDWLGTDLRTYTWVAPTPGTILTFIGLSAVTAVRFLISYFLIGIFYTTIAIISSMVNFMSVKINR